MFLFVIVFFYEKKLAVFVLNKHESWPISAETWQDSFLPTIQLEFSFTNVLFDCYTWNYQSDLKFTLKTFKTKHTQKPNLWTRAPQAIVNCLLQPELFRYRRQQSDNNTTFFSSKTHELMSRIKILRKVLCGKLIKTRN